MEFSSSGDEEEEEELGNLDEEEAAMDIEGARSGGQMRSTTTVVPYADRGLGSLLLGGLGVRTPGPARLLAIPAFEQRREAFGAGTRRVRIVCLSDTHMKHAFLTPFMPQGDDHILLHAGDFTSLGREEHAIEFNEWLGTLHYRHKFIVSGNHERVCGDVRSHSRYAGLLTNGTYVTHGCVTLEEFGGLTIFLSSWEKKHRDNTSAEPELFPWDHPRLSPDENESESESDGGGRRGVDVLVTHMPPRGVLDTVRLVKHRGSAGLRDRVARIRPTVHVFGHVHRGGVEASNGTTFINAANPGTNGPTVFDYYY